MPGQVHSFFSAPGTAEGLMPLKLRQDPRRPQQPRLLSLTSQKTALPVAQLCLILSSAKATFYCGSLSFLSY